MSSGRDCRGDCDGHDGNLEAGIPLTTGKLGEATCSSDEHIVIDREFIKYLMPGKVWYGAAFGT